MGGHAVAAEVASTLQVSRVEVVLASQYKNQVADLKEEFVQAGMANVHFQFARQGQPPQNIGLGRDVPADTAREAIRLAVRYNLMELNAATSLNEVIRQCGRVSDIGIYADPGQLLNPATKARVDAQESMKLLGLTRVNKG